MREITREFRISRRSTIYWSSGEVYHGRVSLSYYAKRCCTPIQASRPEEVRRISGTTTGYAEYAGY